MDNFGRGHHSVLQVHLDKMRTKDKTLPYITFKNTHFSLETLVPDE